MHRLLLLGTGGIAGHHVEEFAKIPGCAIVACVDQVPGRAAAFAAANRIGDFFESLEAAIAWGGFDAAINATPDGAHKATTLALLAAGKHVFCEKPLAPNHADALDMTEAAEAAGVVNMVNLTYRNSPAIQEARRMVQAGEIGELRHVEASYRQSWLVSKSWGDWRVEDKWLWRLSSRHGSTGVLGDVGIHILDFATYGADQDIVSLHADLVTFPKAEGERIGDYVLDANDSVAMTARLKFGALATIVASRYTTGHANDLSLALHGTRGAIKVETDGKASHLSACLGKDVDQQRWRTLAPPDVKRNARRFADALDTGQNGDPSFRRAADMQRLIDAAIESSAARLPVTLG
ncbi:Gfo/Idh/MocA family oxidoreductase [Mesorhizobium qingshengii]|uniref:Gfo/Idh/MocA family oxidoreductase n=1 Tax=Mesorhizobium qingshengii TaxID=1165689 RepID=A0ABT4QS38_9HYPH|nr:Gfo/Idh/MocA family oxidoreductase [Mesorhizobium qingshengii]MCZ8544324.1 Gfo/Idh/MocA family oxidoreductase [Mesorhizobium qingshengii]